MAAPLRDPAKDRPPGHGKLAAMHGLVEVVVLERPPVGGTDDDLALGRGDDRTGDNRVDACAGLGCDVDSVVEGVSAVDRRASPAEGLALVDRPRIAEGRLQRMLLIEGPDRPVVGRPLMCECRRRASLAGACLQAEYQQNREGQPRCPGASHHPSPPPEWLRAGDAHDISSDPEPTCAELRSSADASGRGEDLSRAVTCGNRPRDVEGRDDADRAAGGGLSDREVRNAVLRHQAACLGDRAAGRHADERRHGSGGRRQLVEVELLWPRRGPGRTRPPTADAPRRPRPCARRRRSRGHRGLPSSALRPAAGSRAGS